MCGHSRGNDHRPVASRVVSIGAASRSATQRLLAIRAAASRSSPNLKNFSQLQASSSTAASHVSRARCPTGRVHAHVERAVAEETESATRLHPVAASETPRSSRIPSTFPARFLSPMNVLQVLHTRPLLIQSRVVLQLFRCGCDRVCGSRSIAINLSASPQSSRIAAAVSPAAKRAIDVNAVFLIAQSVRGPARAATGTCALLLTGIPCT